MSTVEIVRTNSPFNEAALRTIIKNRGHQNFKQIGYALLRDKNLRKQLHTIDIMVTPPDTVEDPACGNNPVDPKNSKLLIQPGHMNMSAKNALNLELVESLKVDSRSNMKNEMTIALRNIGFDQEKIEKCTSIMRAAETVRDFKNRCSTDHIAKGMGFPSTASIRTFLLDDSTKSEVQGRRHITLSPEFFLSTIEANKSILEETDPVIIAHMKAYDQACAKQSVIRPRKCDNARLRAIRDHCARNVQCVLAEHAKKEGKGESLADYTLGNHFNLKPTSEKSLSFALKTLITKDVSYCNLDNKSNYPMVFNCFSCPAIVKNEGKQKTNVAEGEGMLDKVNVTRLYPLSTSVEVLNHWLFQHAGNPSKVKIGTQGHLYVIPCALCRGRVLEGHAGEILNMYSCCLNCARDHAIQMHTHEDGLAKLFRELSQKWSDNSERMSIIESFFKVRCCICRDTFPTKIQREKHENTCLIRSITNSGKVRVRST